MYREHHGIKGQKWGVKNGPPYPIKEDHKIETKTGRLSKRGQEEIDFVYPYKNYISRSYGDTYELLEDNLKNINKNSDILKKGSKFYRLANSNEPIDNYRKYLTINKDDHDTYVSMFLDDIGLNTDKGVSEYTYEATKDIRIATGEKVVNDLLKKYGDQKLRNRYNTFKEYESTGFEFVDEYPYKNVDLSEFTVKNDPGAYLKKNKQYVYKQIRNIIKDNMNEISDYYVKKGYDAITDIEDWQRVTDYPIILFNPKESMKLKEENKIEWL